MDKLLPEKIRFFRDRLNLTQEELAERCGVVTSCISRWERGKWSPNSHNALLLANALQVSLQDLCDNEERQIADIVTEQIVSELQELSQQQRESLLVIVKEIKKMQKSL